MFKLAPAPAEFFTTKKSKQNPKFLKSDLLLTNFSGNSRPQHKQNMNVHQDVQSWNILWV